MSSEPAEPEKYSLDEMLERLQNKSSSTPEDSGELVTRADGSQAIKVRKKKRRTRQPKKEAAQRASRLRAIQVSSAVILIILMGLVLGGLLVYANSAPYRQKVISKFHSGTGAKIEFNQLQISPTATTAHAASLNWPEGNLLKSLSLSRSRAQALMGGVIGSSWSVSEITVDSGQLMIGAPQGGQPVRYFPAASGAAPISVDRLAVSKLNVSLGDPAAPSLKILNSEASFYPNHKNGVPSVRLFRGELHVPQWPMFRVDRAMMAVSRDEVEIVNLRLFHELDNNGYMELTGKFNPSTPAVEQSLDVKMTSFNLNGIAGTSLSNLVVGRFDSREIPGSQNHLTFSSSIPTGGKLQIGFASSPNTLPRLNNFSFLRYLSQITDNPWFLDPLFHDGCTGILHRDNGIVRITDLTILSKTQLKVTGDLTIQENETLTGVLHVGLAVPTVTGGRNPALAKVFKEERDGFRWVTLNISGTGARPIDNFAELVQAARGAAAEPGEENKDLFEQLTAPE